MIPSTPCIGDEGAFYGIRRSLGEENQQQWFWREYIGPKFKSGAACFFKAKTNGPDPATEQCEATAAEGKAVEDRYLPQWTLNGSLSVVQRGVAL